MVRTIGAQIGLLAFAVALVAGIYVGNTPTTVLMRALVAMVFGVLAGQSAAWAAKVVLRDHLQQKKLQIDREHLARVRMLAGEPPEAAEPPADAPSPNQTG
jgi:hypothetical protein